MRAIRQVRKRDGRLVEFDESKIADAIYKAALSVGGEDRFLAEEMASVVALFLEKTFPGQSPSIEEVQDMVEKVLIETGHARTAKAFILYREKRSKLREAEAPPAAESQPSLFAPGPVTVLDSGAGVPWSLTTESLAARIGAEADLAPETAEEVAAAVAARVGALGRDSVTDSLLSWFLDAELLVRGLADAMRERGALAVPRHRIERLLFPKEPERTGTPASRVAAGVLTQFALNEVYPEEVTAAHLSGRIRLSGVASPTALHSASISPDAIRAFGIPGVTGRFRPAAVGTPRRFTAWLGRAVRGLAPHATHGLSISRLNLLAAPLISGLSLDAMKEEAWHLLTELAGVPGLEIELALAPSPILAARKARGRDGEPLEETYARFTGTSLQFASALIEVRGTAEGLGGRGELPRLALNLGPGALEEASVRGVLERAVGEALAREPVLFVFEREDLPVIGTSDVRGRLEDPTRLTDTATLSLAVGARAVVNLPRAAYRAGARNPAGFVVQAEEAADLAIAGIRARYRFLKRAAAAPDGPLAPFARPRGEAPPIFDLQHAVHSLGVTGLNEAVGFVLGHELHEADEAVKLGQRVLSAIRLRCREAAGSSPDGEAGRLAVDLDSAESAHEAAAFAASDRVEMAPLARRMPERYTPGVALREDAPVDLALRLEVEGRLGMPLRTSTVRCGLGAEDHPAPETLTALLRKTWENTRVRQVILGRYVRDGGVGW